VSDKPKESMHTFGEASLIDFLESNAVSEFVIVEREPGVYRLEVLVTWRTGRSVVAPARGGVRVWRSLDSVRRFLAALKSGTVPVRLELLP
jgi:hypothetical protein